MKKILFLIFILLLPSISFAQTKIIMKKDGGVYLVPCKVNGLDMEFIFDTGASNVSISLVEALYMIKQGKLSQGDIFGSSYAQLANGSFTENTDILLREILIGDLRLLNVKASVVHELAAPLLLGQSAIEKLGKIQLDNNILTILDKGYSNYDYTNNSYSNNNAKDYDSPHSKLRLDPNSQIVYKHSPILDRPDIVEGKSVGRADDGVVTILEKYDEKYYKVKAGDVIGYIWFGWFK